MSINKPFDPQDQFHEICIAIWETGDLSEYWPSWFEGKDVEYNEERVRALIRAMDDDYMAYVEKQEPYEIVDVKESNIWENH